MRMRLEGFFFSFQNVLRINYLRIFKGEGEAEVDNATSFVVVLVRKS
jgi:hypothetical protein